MDNQEEESATTQKIQNVNLTFTMTVIILMACGLWDGGKR
jgi:hypothetical protein